MSLNKPTAPRDILRGVGVGVAAAPRDWAVRRRKRVEQARLNLREAELELEEHDQDEPRDAVKINADIEGFAQRVGAAAVADNPDVARSVQAAVNYDRDDQRAGPDDPGGEMVLDRFADPAGVFVAGKEKLS